LVHTYKSIKLDTNQLHVSPSNIDTCSAHLYM